MNVLLVEPVRRASYPSMALMKLSTLCKERGDNVYFIRGFGYFLPFAPDVIYITSLFTWNYDEVVDVTRQYKARYPKAEIRVGGIMASLLASKFEQDTGIRPQVGLLEEAENKKLDYSIYQRLQYSIAYTTRSCPNRCGWCMVHRLEPEYQELSGWVEQCVDLRKPRILFHDNNFLACSQEHFDRTIVKIHRLGKEVDFNQGLDCRLYDDYRAKKLSMIRVNPLRFSWDSRLVDGTIQGAVMRAHGLGEKNISIYMLFNHNEEPEEIWRRLSVLNQLHVSVFPMHYTPLDSIVKSKVVDGEYQGYVGRYWTPELLSGFRYSIYGDGSDTPGFRDGCIGSGLSRQRFEDFYGRSETEFTGKLISWHKASQNGREKNRLPREQLKISSY